MSPLRIVSHFCNFAIFVIPTIILTGWATGSMNLKLMFHTSGTVMNPMSAACFLVLGTSLFFARGESKKLGPLPSVFFAALPLVVSLLHSSEVFSQTRLDQLLFRDQLSGNVMPLHTAIGFAIASVTVFLFRLSGKGALAVAPLLALAVGWLALLAITGHFYGADMLTNMSTYSPMAFSTAFTFIFFSLSVLFAKPKFEPTRTFVSPSAAGKIARRLIPLAIFFPIFSGWLRMTLEAHGFFDQKLGVTIFAAVNIGLWTSAIWTTAHSLFEAEEKNKQLINLLDRTSKMDLLSGVWNRRYLEHRIESELATFKRHGTALSCIITDIDHFKKVNDTYGHHVGDVVIKAVAQILNSTVRKEDIVCRYGGEEFVVILPGTEEAEACLLAERLRVAVEDCLIKADGHEVRVTCSFGVAQADLSSPALVEQADAALYTAKKSGRNRVVASAAVQAA